jgi:hypothetical protein
LVTRRVVFIALGPLLIAKSAWAEPPSPERDPIYLSGDATVGFHGLSGLGVTGGVDFGLDLLARFRIIEAGLVLDAGGPLLGPGNRTVVGGLVGLGSHGDGAVGGDLLFEGGMHIYSGVGLTCLLCGDPGASGAVGFVGARAGLTFQGRHERNPTLLVLGLWAWADVDTSTKLVSYTYLPACGLFNCPTQSVTNSALVGGAFEIGLAFRVGFDVQLNARQFDRDRDKDSVPSPAWDDERP